MSNLFLISNRIAVPEVSIKTKCTEMKLKYNNLEFFLDKVFTTPAVQG